MVFVVAEIGVNWNGDFTLVQQMMKEAKKCGCDAVKFQAFNEENIGQHPQKELLLKTSISKANIDKINKIAKKIDIEWFCTPMYPDAVDMLNPYVKRFKIRYGDCEDIFENQSNELFQKILNTNKEIIISSKSQPKENLKRENIKWLYVVPKYPCSFDDLDFRDLKEFDGYSNHCPHFLAPLSAVILGAKIIEVHITSDKSKNFFDNNVSFDYFELKELLRLIHLYEKIKK